MTTRKDNIDPLNKRLLDKQPVDRQVWNKNIDAHQKAVIDGEVGSPPKPIRKIVDVRNEPAVKPGEMLEDDKFTQT